MKNTLKHMRKRLIYIAGLAIAVIILLLMVLISSDIDKDESSQDATAQIKVYCSPSSRSTGSCQEKHSPVCGWFNPEKVQCVKEPCAITFSNNCYACLNPEIEFWTRGGCTSTS